MTDLLNPKALDHAAKEMRKAVHLGAEWGNAAGIAITEYRKKEREGRSMDAEDIARFVIQVTRAIDNHTRAIHARTLYLVESNDTDRGLNIRADWRERITGELRRLR